MHEGKDAAWNIILYVCTLCKENCFAFGEKGGYIGCPSVSASILFL